MLQFSFQMLMLPILNYWRSNANNLIHLYIEFNKKYNFRRTFFPTKLFFSLSLKAIYRDFLYVLLLSCFEGSFNQTSIVCSHLQFIAFTCNILYFISLIYFSLQFGINRVINFHFLLDWKLNS